MATNRNSYSVSERQKVVDEILSSLPFLKGFARSLTRNNTRADDLVQQTILNAIANIHEYQYGSNLRGWLTTILRNQFNTEWRKRKREDSWNPKFDNSLLVSTGFGEGEAGASYDLNRILLYLACLPAEQSDALIAIGYLGMSYEEAKNQFGCSVGTVKSRVNRARLALIALTEESILKHVDVSRLKTMTRGMSESDKYFPIAKAYEELYADVEGVSKDLDGKDVSKKTLSVSQEEQHWRDLVASGALDHSEETLADLMRGSEK